MQRKQGRRQAQKHRQRNIQAHKQTYIQTNIEVYYSIQPWGSPDQPKHVADDTSIVDVKIISAHRSPSPFSVHLHPSLPEMRRVIHSSHQAHERACRVPCFGQHASDSLMEVFTHNSKCLILLVQHKAQSLIGKRVCGEFTLSSLFGASFSTASSYKGT